jgi:hypothetical protein
MRAACPFHLILLELITLTTFSSTILNTTVRNETKNISWIVRDKLSDFGHLTSERPCSVDVGTN